MKRTFILFVLTGFVLPMVGCGDSTKVQDSVYFENGTRVQVATVKTRDFFGHDTTLHLVQKEEPNGCIDYITQNYESDSTLKIAVPAAISGASYVGGQHLRRPSTNNSVFSPQLQASQFLEANANAEAGAAASAAATGQ